MGSLTRMNAQNRFKDALSQALNAADSPEERESVYNNAIEQLARIAMDEEELHRVAVNMAEDPTTIDWPDGFEPEQYAV